MDSRALTRWDPEDPAFWAAEGRGVANRNLWISILSLALAFAVWMVWSAVVVNLPNAGFDFSTQELFWLCALPALSGATLRIFYSVMVPIFGGRRWTAISTASLLLPMLGLALAVQDPSTSYWSFVVLALLAGLGGGNFASSMANINFFFPEVQKGTALGLNAGLGNLGVSLVQFVVPVVITAGLFGALGGEPQTWSEGTEVRRMWLQNAGLVWVPFIVACTIAAWLFMDDLAAMRPRLSDYRAIFANRHAWIVSWLYLGTFGSFIGYAAAFPLLSRTQFPQFDSLAYAWLGPMIGALIRPMGGWLSEKFGGGPVTFWNFVAMLAGVAGVLAFLPRDGEAGNFFGFLAVFMLLFMTSGIGNGSIFHMIPSIFLQERRRRAAFDARADGERAAREADAAIVSVLGFSSAIGAYGGFVIPVGLGASIALTGTVETSMYVFIVFYLTCIALTWWCYWRRGAAIAA